MALSIVSSITAVVIAILVSVNFNGTMCALIAT